jgi:hypothetical protein
MINQAAAGRDLDAARTPRRPGIRPSADRLAPDRRSGRSGRRRCSPSSARPRTAEGGSTARPPGWPSGSVAPKRPWSTPTPGWRRSGGPAPAPGCPGQPRVSSRPAGVLDPGPTHPCEVGGRGRARLFGPARSHREVWRRGVSSGAQPRTRRATLLGSGANGRDVWREGRGHARRRGRRGRLASVWRGKWHQAGPTVVGSRDSFPLSAT